MAVLLVIPIWLGWLLATRVLNEPDRLTAAVLAAPLGLALTNLGVNGLYLYGPLERAIGYTLAAQALLALGLQFGRPRPKTEDQHPPWAVTLLALIALVIYLFSNAQQIANPDDDYWIHAPLQGLMLHGNFPPTNPFFSDIPMNGHYGRNLSIVTVAALTGKDTFRAQVVMTNLLQVLTWLLLYVALKRSTGSPLQAFMAAFFMYFGINAGGRGGLLDTLQNNNAYVHLYLALIADLTLRTWQSARWPSAVLGGLVLGGYAIVYETHFGLCLLVLVGVTPILYFGRRITPRAVLLCLLLLGIAMPIACTQGGPLTNIVQRKLSGQKDVEAEKLSKGMQNQSQVVKITVPKKALFQILLETGEYQRSSYVYRLDTPLKLFYRPATDRGYRYIWSWEVLRIHFLPLYLLPLSIYVLLRRLHPAGLFLGAFGVIAYLVPALVDFGPIYESEYYRWQFAASLGFAGALGLALAVLWEDYRQRHPGIDWTYENEPRRLLLLLYRPGLLALLLALLTALNSLASFTFLGSRFSQVSDWGGWFRGALMIPNTQSWLERHAVLDFEAADYEMARWLAQRSRPGERILIDFAEENNFSILFESTWTGVSGVRCVGHALPLDDEKIGTTPFHRAPPAQLFWAHPDTFQLRWLKVDWLYVRDPETVLELEGVELVKELEGRRLYRVSLEPLEARVPREPHPALRAYDLFLPEHNRAGQVLSGLVGIRNQGSEPVPLQPGLAISTRRRDSGKESVPVEWVMRETQEVLAPGESRLFSLKLAAPHEDGDYEVRFWMLSSGQEISPPEAGLTVDFRSQLERVKVARFELPTVPRAGQLVEPLLELEVPEGFQQEQEVLASLACYDRERKRFYLLPGINMRKLPLQQGKPLPLPLVLPENPGRYEVNLYLSPEQGELIRVPAGEIEVVP